MSGRISIEPADPRYGLADQVVWSQDEVEAVELAEDASLQSHTIASPAGARPIAFVDGVRRSEAWLYYDDAAAPPAPTGDGPAGVTARGLAGAFGVGCVRVEANRRPEFGEHRIERLLIWGSGASVDDALPDVEGGWRWRAAAIPDVDPDAPLHELQRRMRIAEAELAEELAAGELLTVLDGTLATVRAPDVAIVGYVKTHHRALLAPDQHALVPRLRAGERTTLFQLHRQGLRGRPYSCYFRLADSGPLASPWSGIVRLEVPESGGLERARRLIDAAAAVLAPFAGVPHRDPRAPQNLQPIGALETHLRHLLGSPALAMRAVRDAVARSRVDALAGAGAPTAEVM
ncbi:MAG TPA: hypothetical protein VHR17_01390 [Thermoanaerobaculia bacterium]|nr:hypothetical protein [Thermoanaerobaculia bacterium]